MAGVFRVAHPPVELLGGVARGSPPPSDGLVSVLPPPSPRFSAVLAFTGHHVVAADVSPEWVRERLVGGDVGEPLGPAFLAALCAATGRLLLGRGLAGRWEVAVAVQPEARNGGLGRALFRAARHLVPEGGPVWAQVAPGNVSSLRALLQAGFAPAGAEALLVRPS